MKTKHILVLLFLSIGQLVTSQITPIETITTSDRKISYNSNNHVANKLIVKNQPYDLMLKLRENVKLDSSPNISFVGVCLGESTLSSIDKIKTTLVLEHIINESGNTLSCSLVNHGERVTLSDSQIECILAEAINNTFSFSGVPSDVSNFFI